MNDRPSNYVADPHKARRIADVLRKELKIKKPPVVAIQVANALGLHVEMIRLKDRSEDVVAFYDHDHQTIFVNERAPIQLINFAVAREIGHHLMHPEYIKKGAYRIPVHTDFYRNDDPYIMEATAFASCLLANQEWMLDRHGYVKAIMEKTGRSVVDQLADLCVVPNRVVENERSTPAYVN